MITLGRGRDGRYALLRDGVSPTHAAIVGTVADWRLIEVGLRSHSSVAAGDAVFKANELGGWKAWSKAARSGDVVALSTLEALQLADVSRELAAFGRDAGDRPDPTRDVTARGTTDDDELIDEDPTQDPVDALRVLLVKELREESQWLHDTSEPVVAQALERLANRIAKARVS